jgi:hypothetical protein
MDPFGLVGGTQFHPAKAVIGVAVGVVAVINLWFYSSRQHGEGQAKQDQAAVSKYFPHQLMLLLTIRNQGSNSRRDKVYRRDFAR